MTAPSPLGVQQDGYCTITRPGKKPKIRYATAEEAAMGLIEAREAALRLGHDTCPVAYYPCGACDGGYHLTGKPKPLTIYQGPAPRR